jgi:hypothetical protein
MYSTDPLFGTIADLWMQTLCADFNCTDHWYQMDVSGSQLLFVCAVLVFVWPTLKLL